MKIAVIGWGSLIWSERNLNVVKGPWNSDGPELPIEFSRISTDRRLTLVIDPRFSNVKTYWKLSGFSNMPDAVENLRVREHTPDISDIGFLDLKHGKNYIANRHAWLLDTFEQWAIGKQLDGVLWTDLAPKFTSITDKPFETPAIQAFFENLEDDRLKRAFEYVFEAPEQTKTSKRREIQEILETLMNLRALQ